MTSDAKAWGLALLAVVALTACDKAVTGGNANAPGKPGTGNARETTVPGAPDTPERSSGTAVPGMTRSGTSEPGGRSQSPQAGSGTAGGLGGSSGLGMTGSFPAASGARAPASGSR